MMIINAVVAAFFGVAFVLVPSQAISLYGVEEASEILILILQLMGAAFVGFAVLTWLARNASDSDARRAIVLALIVSDGIGFIAALIAQLADVVNSLGWSTVAIYLLLALGWGYFQFAKPAERDAPSFGE
jgi:Trk-type K+ transport system membrane component